MDNYGLDDCLEILRPAASRALSLQLEGLEDKRLTFARRLINAKNVLNLWLRTETLNHQRTRLTVPLNEPEEPSGQTAPSSSVVFKLHQQEK